MTKANYKLHVVREKDRTFLYGVLTGILFTVIVSAILWFLIK